MAVPGGSRCSLEISIYKQTDIFSIARSALHKSILTTYILFITFAPTTFIH
ncbi:hypothetical protein ACU8KH_04924 [Lachancea thermotolerans]